jgi:hypothetical protein
MNTPTANEYNDYSLPPQINLTDIPQLDFGKQPKGAQFELDLFFSKVTISAYIRLRLKTDSSWILYYDPQSYRLVAVGYGPFKVSDAPSVSLKAIVPSDNQSYYFRVTENITDIEIAFGVKNFIQTSNDSHYSLPIYTEVEISVDRVKTAILYATASSIAESPKMVFGIQRLFSNWGMSEKAR